MRHGTRALLAALLSLTAVPALAQNFPQTLPPNTVYGRLGTSAGPGQAIPFTVLHDNLFSQSFHITIAGTGFATGMNGLNSIQASDNMTVTPGCSVSTECNPDASAGPNWQNVSGLLINYHTGGSNVAGNRGAAFLNVWVDAPGAASDVTGGFYNSLFMSAAATVNSNGSVGNPRGFLYNMGAQAIVKSAATHWHSVVGYEQDVAVETGATVQNKVGVFVTQLDDDAVQGVVYDAAIMIGAAFRASPVGWRCGFCTSQMGNGGGQGPLAATGTLIGTVDAQTFGNFMDITSATVTKVFKLTGAQKTIAQVDLDVPGLNAASNTFNGGQNFINPGARAVGIYSLNAGQKTWMTVGRTTDELTVGIAAGSNDFMTGTSAGDIAMSATANIFLGIGTAPGIQVGSTGQAFSGANIFTRAANPAVIVRSAAAGSFADITVGRTADELFIGVAASGNQFITGTVAGEAAISGQTALWLGTGGTAGIKIGTSGALRFPQLGAGTPQLDASGNVTSASAATMRTNLAVPGLATSNAFTLDNTFTRAANPAVIIRSGASGSFASLDMGRTANEVNYGVAASANQFLTGSAAGDTAISATGDLWLGKNPTPGIKLTTSGAIVFPQLTTGLAHVGASGAVTSSAVALASADVSGTLAVANGGTNYTGGAFTTYTPTLSCASGTLTSATSSGASLTIGKLMFVRVRADITTNGTCAGALNFTSPGGVTAQGSQIMAGRAAGVSGKQLQGIISSGASSIVTDNYDGTYPGANGEIIIVSGVIEIQ